MPKPTDYDYNNFGIFIIFTVSASKPCIMCRLHGSSSASASGYMLIR